LLGVKGGCHRASTDNTRLFVAQIMPPPVVQSREALGVDAFKA